MISRSHSYNEPLFGTRHNEFLLGYHKQPVCRTIRAKSTTFCEQQIIDYSRSALVLSIFVSTSILVSTTRASIPFWRISELKFHPPKIPYATQTTGISWNPKSDQHPTTTSTVWPSTTPTKRRHNIITIISYVSISTPSGSKFCPLPTG